ncbi:hypothetical protein EMA8858_00063 [Emticicia aquatica]|uniref:Uncharacterized protein n=1 Tax=Emticicia aquatica TaxID=1681835 RepID=A0ABN8EMD1_9BACT|nr:hypothetical protein [Emticicia aquatica]CAH0993958.1 hypothetical protein EMA8858_00063 [Emticicia aquatica]
MVEEVKLSFKGLPNRFMIGGLVEFIISYDNLYQALCYKSKTTQMNESFNEDDYFWFKDTLKKLDYHFQGYSFTNYLFELNSIDKNTYSCEVVLPFSKLSITDIMVKDVSKLQIEKNDLNENCLKILN